MSYQRINQKLTKYGERHLDFGYPRTKNCISAFFSGPIYFAFTLKYQSYFLRNFMKGFMEAIQETDLCLTEPLLKAIGGQICKRKHRNM